MGTFVIGRRSLQRFSELKLNWVNTSVRTRSLPLKTSGTIALKLLWGMFLLWSSVYGLLAFLPYTNAAFIKAPPYDWLPWFVHHYALLYWPALFAAAFVYRTELKRRDHVLLFVAQGALGVYLTVRPFMGTLESNWTTFTWALVGLVPLIVVNAAALMRPPAAQREETHGLLNYGTAIAVAIALALLWVVGVKLRIYGDTHAFEFGANDLELSGWSLLSHVLVAVVVVSVLNLISMASDRTRRPGSTRRLLTGTLIFVGAWFVLVRFLDSALSFDGWAADVYAGAFSAAVTLFGFSLVRPLLERNGPQAQPPRTRNWMLWATMGGIAVLSLAFPWLIGGADWSGVIQHTVALACWLALGVCAYALHPKRAGYSVVVTLLVLLVSGVAYKGLQISAIFWGGPLGKTDDEIAITLENYASQDASFALAHHALGNARSEPCGDLCRILRQYTNITNFNSQAEVKLVDPLLPARGDKPNIFLFVIDSMRADYLGAYNPKVDFTPNLDAFARDSVAMKNVYTQYAGTSLSEPAIWSGSLLLHHHDLSSFPKLNSLEKLVRVDNYQMVVSYDTVVTEMNVSAPDIIKLDMDKNRWNQYEACSTVQQLEQVLDKRTDKSPPVFFYSQPMNVHQFARNGLPGPASTPDWHGRPGFNERIAFEVNYVDKCLGGFFSYLKAHALYDNSMVIVTADHGDATGEFGRYSHSTTIYPEIMKVPLIVHLPAAIRQRVIYDDSRVSTLTDIAPSLYYLLGHRPVKHDALFGRPLFAETREELDSYRQDDLFMASDVRAVYGILAQNGRFLYVTYDSPAQSMLFDLQNDPNAQHNILTGPLKQQYDEQIIGDLHRVGQFYGYHPGLGSLLTAKQ